MEADDYGKLPPEVFVKGFIKLYCQYLGLDSEKGLKKYTSRTGGGDEYVDRVPVQEIFSSERMAESPLLLTRKTIFTFISLIIIGSIIYVGARFFTNMIKPPVISQEESAVNEDAGRAPQPSGGTPEKPATLPEFMKKENTDTSQEVLVEEEADERADLLQSETRVPQAPNFIKPTQRKEVKTAPVPAEERMETAKIDVEPEPIEAPDTVSPPRPPAVTETEPEEIGTEENIAVTDETVQPEAAPPISEPEPTAPQTAGPPEKETEPAAQAGATEPEESITEESLPGEDPQTAAKPDVTEEEQLTPLAEEEEEPEQADNEFQYTLTAQFNETTWLRVRIDDQPSRQYTYNPGSSRTWEANNSINIFLGNAGGAELTLNGTELPPLGPSGKVARFRIPEDLDEIGFEEGVGRDNQ